MEKAAVVEVGAKVVEEVVQRRKNCHFAFAHRSDTKSSSSAPWTVSIVTLLLISLVALIQLYVSQVGLLKLPLH